MAELATRDGIDRGVRVFVCDELVLRGLRLLGLERRRLRLRGVPPADAGRAKSDAARLRARGSRLPAGELGARGEPHAGAGGCRPRVRGGPGHPGSRRGARLLRPRRIHDHLGRDCVDPHVDDECDDVDRSKGARRDGPRRIAPIRPAGSLGSSTTSLGAAPGLARRCVAPFAHRW